MQGDRGADVLSRTLVAAGVRRVFALSGNHVMPVFDAALDAGLEIVHVRHEAAAVHMADAWGRLTGKPGVALVTGGPGHANAVSALYVALAAESPLVLLSGHAPLNALGKGAFQEMAQAELAAPVTKASGTARSADSLGTDVAQALSKAASGRPGPVHLSLPSDVLEARTRHVPQGQFRIDKEKIEKGKASALLEVLLKAKRPLILTGPAALHAEGRKRLAELEERCGVPVIAMESPRGVNDPSLGKLAEILVQADAVLLLGKRIDFTLKFGAAFSPGARILETVLDTESLISVSPGGRVSNPWKDEVHAALRFRPAEWRTLRSQPGAPLHPAELCRAVAPLLEASGAVLVSDGGEFGQWAQACLEAPRRVINGPAGGIGAALPFAAAAKLAFPDAPVVAMTGDGAFGFHMSELDTALRHGLAYVAVIGNDACWNAEHQIQVAAYGRDRAKGCELLPTRYGAAATALGAHGEDLSRAEELAPALARAAGAGRPACLNVLIERVPAPRY